MIQATPGPTADALRAAGAAQRHRRALVILGDAAARRAGGAATLAGACLWLGDDPPLGVPALPVARAAAALGRAFDTVVLDLSGGLRPDALGAVSGALRAGGLLVLLDAPRPAWARDSAAPQGPAPAGARLARRLARILSASPACTILHLAAAADAGPARPAERAALPAQPAPRAPAEPTADQATAIAAIERLVLGRARRPVVLTADRGRGKSAALGIAVGRRLAERPLQVVVTGPSAAAVAPVLEHAARILGVDAPVGGPVHGPGGGTLRYLPAGELCQRPVAADLVLVDEAATLPVPLLAQLLDRSPRIGFSTTIHGYEGTGRGFALRFCAHLDARTPGWRAVTLHTPVRYAAGDPVEAALSQALCLAADAASDDAVMRGLAGPNAPTLCRLDRGTLAQDDPTLGALFGLLVNAHYRTTPSDLGRLLDDDGQRIYAVQQAGHLLGAAWIAEEGGLSPALTEAIARGERRPGGHLIPAALSVHLGLTQAPRLRGWRVVRIAVHPAARRQGLGRALLDHIAQDAAAAGADLLGSSFGASADLLGFWGALGLLPVRLGVQPSKSAGERSALVLRPLSAAGATLYDAARAQLSDELPHAAAGPLADLPIPLLCALGGRAGPGEGPRPADLAIARACCAGHRGLDGSVAPVWRLTWWALRRPAVWSALPPAQATVLARRVLQRWPWPAVATAAGLSGRRATEQAARAGLEAILAATL